MKIKLYTRAGDPYSDMIKNLLKYHNVGFELVEVSRDQEKKKELFLISGQYNTPVIQIDDKVYTGFDREKIKEFLGITENRNKIQ